MLRLHLLDTLFTIVHSAVVLVNMFGWIHPRTRRLQRFILDLTTLSWRGVGAIYGWGYCFLTDWQWLVKRELGHTGLPASFIQYVLRDLWGFAISDFWVYRICRPVLQP